MQVVAVSLARPRPSTPGIALAVHARLDAGPGQPGDRVPPLWLRPVAPG